MTDHVAIVGLIPADPSLPSPKADTKLRDRAGWEHHRLTVPDREGTREIDAMVRGEFAVNQMLDDEGFTISLVANGWRVSHGYRVFATSDGAAEVAEAMAAAHSDWTAKIIGPYPKAYRDLLGALCDNAQAAGLILRDLTFPHAVR